MHDLEVGQRGHWAGCIKQRQLLPLHIAVVDIQPERRDDSSNLRLGSSDGQQAQARWHITQQASVHRQHFDRVSWSWRHNYASHLRSRTPW